MGGFERGIADVFAALENFLISSGATQSMLHLAWAVLTFLWLGHVAVSMRPGGAPDIVATFGRLFVAGGLLAAIGSLNRTIILAFETLRDAGSAVLSGLISQSWSQFKEWLDPQGGIFQLLGQLLGPVLTHPWALDVLLLGILLGVLLVAIGFTVYLAILFFAHLTLLLALFLAPLAVALLATPGTARWTGRWAVVIVKTGLVVFSVRVVHAAAIYLAVILPVQQVSTGLTAGLGRLGRGPSADEHSLFVTLLHVVLLLVQMFVGTGIGVYAMLRAERLTGQFVDGVAFGEGIFGGPMWLVGRLLPRASHQAMSPPGPSVVESAPAAGSGAPGGSSGGGAQEATVVQPGGRLHL